MKYKHWLALISVIAIVGWLVYVNSVAQHDDELARELSQKSIPTVGDTRQAADQSAPPDDMLVAWIPTDHIWFVGKFEDGGGVEIPFRPGRSPEKSGAINPVAENPGFVGPEQCQQCHKEIFQSFVETAHYKTSRPVGPTTIDGSFATGTNTLQTSDPNVSFEMVHEGERFYQRVHFFNWSFQVPMEIIMGSSKMAQTYLYWHQDGLYQHNVTHITDGDKWVNSPGYIDGDAAYARPIPQRCLDCHLTYFDFRGNVNHYTPQTFIFGVTCERCHGPGKDHVAYHQDNQMAQQAVSITNPKRLERQIQMEVCGQCHSGSRHLKGDALRFRPGDRLDPFYEPPNNELDTKNSVHTSNQLTRLSQSACFLQSEMTCIDCHDPHHNERGDQALFSKRCMACHQKESDCAFYPQQGLDFASNCVDCHMPQRATERLQLKSVEGDVFPPLRDHMIRVDQEATEAYLKQIKPAVVK